MRKIGLSLPKNRSGAIIQGTNSLCQTCAEGLALQAKKKGKQAMVITLSNSPENSERVVLVGREMLRQGKEYNRLKSVLEKETKRKKTSMDDLCESFLLKCDILDTLKEFKEKLRKKCHSIIKVSKNA